MPSNIYVTITRLGTSSVTRPSLTIIIREKLENVSVYVPSLIKIRFGWYIRQWILKTSVKSVRQILFHELRAIRANVHLNSQVSIQSKVFVGFCERPRRLGQILK